MTTESTLLPLVKKFFEYDIKVAAHSLERMTEDEATEVLKALPIPLAVQAMKQLQVSYAAALLKDANPEYLNAIVSHLEPQFASSLLMHLPQQTREQVLESVTGKMKDQIRDFLSYPEGSAGRIMTTDFLTFHEDVTAEATIEKIRSLAKRSFPASYLYVVDNDNRLIGVINMRDLMLASPEEILSSVMRKDVFSIHCFVDKKDAANELSKRKYFAAPVVDGENHILGIIKAERMIQGIQDDISRDIQQMFGVGGDERTFSSILFSLKKRLPWLHVNLATAFLAASVVAIFEDIIARFTVLAIFLPVVAGQGGNAGSQSLAVVMRGIVMREIPKDKIWTLIFKEGRIGAINGIVIGIVTALIAWMWNGNPFLGVVIGLGMLVNLIFAGLFGASIPIFMKRINIDPAQCSSIILTTVTDVIGFFAFLGFAVLFQNYLT